MRELGNGCSQGLIERNVLMGVAQVILPANHMSNSHLQIIDHIDQVKYWASIFSANHQIRFHCSVEGHVPTNQIFHNSWGLGHFKFERSTLFVGLSGGSQFL